MKTNLRKNSGMLAPQDFKRLCGIVGRIVVDSVNDLEGAPLSMQFVVQEARRKCKAANIEVTEENVKRAYSFVCGGD